MQVHTIPVDVWIDANQLLRRFRVTIGASVAGGQTVEVRTTIDVSDYGAQPRPTPLPQTTCRT